MKGAVKILTAFNIPVYVHWSFGMIIAYILYIANTEGFSGTETIWALLTILGLFTCVVLHEFGHALAARRYGVGTEDIALYPIGGIARLEHLPKKPIQEFVVAIAGPLVNFAIVLLILPYIYFFSVDMNASIGGSGFATSAQSFLPTMFALNLVLGIFNLIPAFPMDGGRILRALLAIPFDRVRATLVAARIGQAFGLLAIYLALTTDYTGPFTALIGVFIFMMAQQEYRHVKTEAKLAAHTVGEIMRTNFTRFFPEEPLYSAINELRKDAEKNFLVFNRDEKLVGILDERSILQAMKDERRTADVQEYMVTRIVAVTESMNLEKLFAVMRDGVLICPVMREDEVVGVVDVVEVNKFLRKNK